MKTIEHILRTIFLVIVLIGIGAPESFSQFNIIGKGSTEQLGRTESKKVMKEAKKLLKEIELREKEVSDILQRGAPTIITERCLEDFIVTVSKYNAFCVKYGIEPYKSPLLGQTEITEPQTVSKPNEINTLTVSYDGSAKDEAVKNASNPNDEITLTVTSDGSTKDEAIKNALRTAIEQAYGAFVSANTTILNDELVKDEIVTVSNGSIKEYNILSEYEKPDGSGYGMTVNTTVSLPHLITYAKNHGSECEFAGNTFGMEIKMYNLQKDNELKALYNMIPVVKELCKTSMHWELEVGEPRFVDISDGYRSVNFRVSSDDNFDLNFDLNYIPSEIEEHILKIKENPSDWCVIPLKMLWIPNEDYSNADYNNNRYGENMDFGVMKYILETLRKLSPDGNTLASYNKKNINYGAVGISGNEFIHLRNSRETLDQWNAELIDAIKSIKNNFVIVDNTGQRSDFCPSGVYDEGKYDRYDRDNRAIYLGTGIFAPLFLVGARSGDSFYKYTDTDLLYYLFDKKKKSRQYECGGYRIFALIPLSEVGKYSSFKIEPKE